MILIITENNFSSIEDMSMFFFLVVVFGIEFNDTCEKKKNYEGFSK